MIVDDASDSDENRGDMYHEWRNKLLLESLAKSSLIKVKRTYGKSFFTKGKIMDIGLFVKAKEIDCVFINTTLSPSQHKNLERYNVRLTH